jgi:hypothetical protein
VTLVANYRVVAVARNGQVTYGIGWRRQLRRRNTTTFVPMARGIDPFFALTQPGRGLGGGGS